MAVGRLVRGLMSDRRTCLVLALAAVLDATCLLLGKVVRCSRDLLVPAGAVRVAALAALLGAPRTIAFVHIAILYRTALDPIAVILNEVVDVVVQVFVSLPG